MKNITNGILTNCSYEPKNPILLTEVSYKRVITGDDNSATSQIKILPQVCFTQSSSEYTYNRDRTNSGSYSNSGSNNTSTFSISDSFQGGTTDNGSGLAITQLDKCTICTTELSTADFSSSFSSISSSSGSTSGFFSTSSNNTRTSSTSSSSSSSESTASSSFESTSTFSLDESGCEPYCSAEGRVETTVSDVSDTIYYDEIKQNITKTSSVCSTDATNTNPETSFVVNYRTTESLSKFLVSSTQGEFPIITETTVPYYKTYTIQTDWTETASTEWTSTETSNTTSFESTIQDTTTNSRNEFGELIEYETTERVNTTKETKTTVSTTTSKETTQTGGTTETTTATESQTNGTDTTLTEDEISTWVEGTSTKFITETSLSTIEVSDIPFCDYAGWVEGCFTLAQDEYIASIKNPVSGESPYFTLKESTQTDTGLITGSVRSNFSTEFHFDNHEALIEWKEPPIEEGTKWCHWAELFTSSSIGEVESTFYTTPNLKQSILDVVYVGEGQEDNDYTSEFTIKNETTFNSITEYYQLTPTDAFGANLQYWQTEYNEAPKQELRSFRYNLESHRDAYIESPNWASTTYTTIVETTSSSKILLPVKYSTEHLGQTHSHLFGWDLLDQIWIDTTVLTYQGIMLSRKSYLHDIYETSATGSNYTTLITDEVSVTDFYSDKDRNILNRWSNPSDVVPIEPLMPDNEANDGGLNKITAVYEPDLAIGYIGFGEVLEEELASASVYGFMIKQSAGETFNSDDELNIDLTNISSAALLAADSASIFYTNPCFGPDLGEQVGTTSWGNTRKCSDDEEDKVLFGTSTEVHATYSKEYETEGSTLTSSAYATYSLSLDMPLENYANPVLLKAFISDSVVGDRQREIIASNQLFGYRTNYMFQLKNVTNTISYTIKKGEYDVSIVNNSNEEVSYVSQTTTGDIKRTATDGNISIRKITSNDIFLYQARNEINSQGPFFPYTYSFGRSRIITPNLEYRFFENHKFTRSDVASYSINGGRVDGWLGPSKSLCESTGG